MKLCFKCEEEKPVSDFYKHPRMADGYLGKCKSCTKFDSTLHRNENIEKVKEYDRNRPNSKLRNEKNKEYQKRRIRMGLATSESNKEWRKRNPDAYAAYGLTANNIRDGKLKKEPCEKCGDLKVDAHHDDYLKPLKIRWLCKKHHAEHHRLKRELERKHIAKKKPKLKR